MAQQKPVEMMGVVVLAGHAPLAKNAVVEVVSVSRIVLDEIVGMMAVEETPVVSAHPPKPAQMVSVSAQLLPNALEEFVVPIEQVEAVEVAQLAKDVDLGNVSVIMIVMREIAEMQFKKQEPIWDSVLREAVVPVPMDSLVAPMVDALP